MPTCPQEKEEVIMDNAINKLFEFYDTKFFERKIEVDSDGKYGLNYDGLCFDTYIENSIYDIDYLSIEDYFYDKAKVNYNERSGLFEQYSNLSLDKRLDVINAILNLVKKSSYRIDEKDYILKKSISFLERFGLAVTDIDDEIVVSSQLLLGSGSYSNVYMEPGSDYLKKQMKPAYVAQTEWVKRFQNEFTFMERLSSCPYVLKVFSYNADENSYLMEKCDCDLFEYYSKRPFIEKEELERIADEILNAIAEIHRNGIIHRDLHLGNILMKNGSVIISDFGLSKDAMIVQTLKSTSTPKNSHYFMDPTCLSDFTKLDKLSDIYSVGKIMEWLFQENDLLDKYSFIIDKATARDRKKRYSKIEDMQADIDSLREDVSEEEKIKMVDSEIERGIYSPAVNNYVLDLCDKGDLSNYLVSKKIWGFERIILQFSETEQQKILREIDSNYSAATGYGHFENYELFASLAYEFIKKSNKIHLQKLARSILDGCASYRYNASNMLQEIDVNYPYLLHSK
ncbi:protein kinase [Enterococcus cecorum]|nr:protein kinase [Enterococcus cecorum]CAI3302656.1 protein kinase [Enterococcus cecorum]CAI3315005.1 protein kinase [Enterococcus cecorum]CAI3325914.1 protein kinase [Enterococcus cecorum]CAI3329449.1 protein kinase [Enterococcus cecorum]